MKRRLTWEDVIPFPENPIYPRRVESMRRRWGGYRHDIVGSPAIFDNSAGAYPELPADVLLTGDGNHRRELARQEGMLSEEFLADLYRGLSRAEMHKVRRGLNDRRTVKPAEDFLHISEESQLSAQARIQRAVEGLGWEITYDRADGGLSCTNELEWIWERDQGALTLALQTYERVWGKKAERGQARVIKGLGVFWIRYPKAELDRLVAALSGQSVEELYAAGRNQYNVLSFIKTVAHGVRYVAVVEYNRQSRKGQLPL